MAGAERLLKDLPETLGPDVRVVRAPCMGACDHAPVCCRRPCAGDARRPIASVADCRIRRRMRTRCTPGTDFEHYMAAGGYRAAGRGLHRQAHPRRIDQDRQRRRPARPRRRRLPDRPQVVAGARRAGAAPDGGQRRRGRARHVQGPLLPRPRSAPLPRRHADRRLGGRSGRGLHLHPRRISRAPPDAGRRDRQASSAPVSTSSPRSICAAAPAPTSAAKNPR